MRAGAAALRQPDDPHVGSVVAGRFEVEALLGQGGMGAVYRVRDIGSGRRHALKRLLAQELAQHVTLFEREYHTLASLRHHHVVEAYDYGRDELGPFYCMELLEGADVQSASPLPWPEVCRILRDVCSALGLVHARGLVHRDISPRNVWRTTSGLIKLIDFGAVCAFGVPVDIAGTPPFVPPEALSGANLDQRSDLFALGALGYWLLTGMHAFPARSLADLQEVWSILPLPPSVRTRELGRPDLPEIPQELDSLVGALLTMDPQGRPNSATEVMDRLVAVAGLENETQSVSMESHLRSKRFVGRPAEREMLARLVKRVFRKHGECLFLEGEQGLGRTRAMSELALDARVAGCSVVEDNAALHDGPLGLAISLAHKLWERNPAAALAAARPVAAVLGHASPSLMNLLGLKPSELAPMPQVAAEVRIRVQAALEQWVLTLSQQSPLSLFIDDLQAADEASLSFLTGLVHNGRQAPLLIVVAYRAEPGRSEGAAIASLRQNARCVQLSPFTLEQTRALLGSIFGEVPHLGRVADVLHRVSEGVPDHCLQLAEHLVGTQVVRFAQGTWILPADIPLETLPKGRAQRLATKLARLSDGALQLASVLSVHEGLFRVDVCTALSDLDPSARSAALDQLVDEGILVRSAEGYRFEHSHVQTALQERLSEAQARDVHRRLGMHLREHGAGDSLSKLRAGYHLLRGASGERETERQAAALVSEAGIALATDDTTPLPQAAPMLEACLAILRAQGRPRYELVTVLAPLAVASYYADRRLAPRYGDEAVAVLEETLGLHRARRWQRLLGAKLGLFAALIPAAILLRLRRRNPCVPSFRQAMVLLFTTIATLSGVKTICIDPDGAERLASVLRPLVALGPNHIASLMYEFCVCLSGTVRDRVAQARARWQSLLERLQHSVESKGLTDDMRNRYRAGALYAMGVTECWRDDSRALAIADELDTFGMRLYQLSADQLRMFYYANQGNFELSEKYRAKVELHAIQAGTAWQVETWSPGAMITVHLRAQDAMRLKRCVEELEHLKKDTPSLDTYARRARGAYLLVRGKPEQALEWLQSVLQERPLSIVGWARSMGVLARAHNELAQYAEAQRVCLLALRELPPLDLEFVALNLGLEIEAAIAQAGLGEHAHAIAALSALLTRHEPHKGLLTLGAIHEALARVHDMAGDQAAAGRHYDAVQRYYRATKVAPLIERCERIVWKRNAEDRSSRGADSGSSHSTSRHLDTVVHWIRHGGANSQESGALWALEQLARFASFDEGYLYLVQDERVTCAARLGAEPAPPELDAWAADRLRACLETSVTPEIEGMAQVSDDNRLTLQGKRYRVMPISVGVGSSERTIGGVVALEPPDKALALPFDLLRAVAARVQDLTVSQQADASL